jgi:hypothetical protein
MKIKFVCACGEEVTEDRIKKIYRAEKGILRAAEDIKAGDMLMIEDRPAEPERCSACMGERPGITTRHTMIRFSKSWEKVSR